MQNFIQYVLVGILRVKTKNHPLLLTNQYVSGLIIHWLQKRSNMFQLYSMGKHNLLHAKTKGARHSAIDMARNLLSRISVIHFFCTKQPFIFHPLKKKQVPLLLKYWLLSLSLKQKLMFLPLKQQMVSLCPKQQLVSLHPKRLLVPLCPNQKLLLPLCSKQQLVPLCPKMWLVSLCPKEKLVVPFSQTTTVAPSSQTATVQNLPQTSTAVPSSFFSTNTTHEESLYPSITIPNQPILTIHVEFVFYIVSTNQPTQNCCKRRQVATSNYPWTKKIEAKPEKVVLQWDTSNNNLDSFKAAVFDCLRTQEEESVGNFAKSQEQDGNLFWYVVILHRGSFAATHKKRLDSQEIFADFIQVAIDSPASCKITCHLVQKDPRIVAKAHFFLSSMILNPLLI